MNTMSVGLSFAEAVITGIHDIFQHLEKLLKYKQQLRCNISLEQIISSLAFLIILVPLLIAPVSIRTQKK